jgi:hypothetical protein
MNRTPFFDLTTHHQLDLSTLIGGSETDAVDELVKIFQPYFHIQREIKGLHFSGRRLRLDLLLRPRNSSEWKNPDTAFGIEVKMPNTERGWGECSRHFAQACDYANTLWDNVGLIPIFCWPIFMPRNMTVTLGDFPQGEEGFFYRVAGQMNVGFVYEAPYHGVGLSLCGHTIWNQCKGVCEGRFWSLKHKVGSR